MSTLSINTGLMPFFKEKLWLLRGFSVTFLRSALGGIYKTRTVAVGLFSSFPDTEVEIIIIIVLIKILSRQLFELL